MMKKQSLLAVSLLFTAPILSSQLTIPATPTRERVAPTLGSKNNILEQILAINSDRLALHARIDAQKYAHEQESVLTLTISILELKHNHEQIDLNPQDVKLQSRSVETGNRVKLLFPELLDSIITQTTEALAAANQTYPDWMQLQKFAQDANESFHLLTGAIRPGWAFTNNELVVKLATLQNLLEQLHPRVM